MCQVPRCLLTRSLGGSPLGEGENKPVDIRTGLTGGSGARGRGGRRVTPRFGWLLGGFEEGLGEGSRCTEYRTAENAAVKRALDKCLPSTYLWARGPGPP